MSELSHGRQMHTLTVEEKKVGKNRADFMRRFFSIAVSVGFASKLRDFRFLSSIQDIKIEQIFQFVLLVLAMIIVVGSWEFYFRSIDDDEKPLKDTGRFIVDIVIVSFYIILLQSITSFGNFLLYTNIIVLLYVIWDILAIRAYPEEFGAVRFDVSGIMNVYRAGFLLRGRTGPSTTLWWLMVIVAVSVSHLIYRDEFYGIAAGTAVTYMMYRADQNSPWRPRRRVISTATFIVGLVIFLAIEHEVRG